MKKTRGPLLLASVASLAAMTGTQAADLPVKAKPVEYVKICSLYGAGFYYIPGTDTCIRIGGHIRAEVSFTQPRHRQSQRGPSATATRPDARSRYLLHAQPRSFLNVDTRTQTSFGTLRTFSVVRSETHTAVGLAGATTAINLDTAIIQWGGFTIGRAGTSYFDNPWVYAFKWGSNGSYRLAGYGGRSLRCGLHAPVRQRHLRHAVAGRQQAAASAASITAPTL